MTQDNNIMDTSIGAGYSASFLNSDQAANELVSLQREQLGVLQQINIKSSSSGIMDSLIDRKTGLVGTFDGPEEELLRSVKEKAERSTDGFLKKITTPTFNSVEFQQNQGMIAGQSFFRPIAGIATTAMSIGGNLLGSAIPGIGGFVAGPALGALAAAYGANGLKQAEIKSVYDQYMLNYSSGFIDFTESNNMRSGQGFSVAESMKMGQSIYNMAPSLRLSQDQMQNLTMQFAESGMLRSSSSVQDTSNKIKDLSRQAKEISVMLNQTVESAAEFMSQMNKIGLASGDYTGVASGIKLSSGLFGVDTGTLASATVNNIATLVSGTGISGINAANNTTLNTMMGGMIYSQYSKANPNTMTYDQSTAYNYMNNIGRENVGAEISSIQNAILNSQFAAPFIAANYKYNSQTGQMEHVGGVNLSGMNLSEIGRIGSQNLSAGGQQNASAVTQFMDTAGQRATNDFSSTQQISMIRDIVNGLIQQSGGKLTATQALTSTFGLSQQQASMYSQYLNVSDESFQAATGLMSAEKVAAQLRGEGYGGIKGYLGSGWQAFKQGAGAPFVAVSNGFGMAGDYINKAYDEALYGDYVTTSEMITNTDYYNLSSKGKLSRLGDYQRASSEAFSAYQNLDKNSKGLINSIFTGSQSKDINESSLNLFNSNASLSKSGFFSNDSINSLYGKDFSLSKASAIEAYSRFLKTEGEKGKLTTDERDLYGVTEAYSGEIDKIIYQYAKENGTDLAEASKAVRKDIMGLEASGGMDVIRKMKQGYTEQNNLASDTLRKLEITDKLQKQSDYYQPKSALDTWVDIQQGILGLGIFTPLFKSVGDDIANSFTGDIFGTSYEDLQSMLSSGEDVFVKRDSSGNIVGVQKNQGSLSEKARTSTEELARLISEEGGLEKANSKLASDMKALWKQYSNASEDGRNKDKFTKNQAFMITKNLVDTGVADSESGVLVSDLLSDKTAEELGFASEKEREAAWNRIAAQSTSLSKDVGGSLLTNVAQKQAGENPLLGEISKNLSASRKYLKAIADKVGVDVSEKSSLMQGVRDGDTGYSTGLMFPSTF